MPTGARTLGEGKKEHHPTEGIFQNQAGEHLETKKPVSKRMV